MLRFFQRLQKPSFVLIKDVCLYFVVVCKYSQGCRSLLIIGGDNLQFYPNFALFSTLGGMNRDHDFYQVSKLSEDQKNKKRSSPKPEPFFSSNSSEDQKKGLHQKWNTFSPNSCGDLHSDANQSQIIGGNAHVDHTQIIGGGGVQ